MNRREFLKTSLAVTAAAAGTAFLGGSLLTAASAQNSNTGVRNGKMKILVITGSPRKNGNSNTLAEHFIKGAQEAGHEVVRFDAAFKEVHPCIGCNRCGMNGPCVFKDDFEFIRKHIVDADLVAFATPMYYFGISAQIKAVIDRFYAITSTKASYTLIFFHNPQIMNKRMILNRITLAINVEYVPISSRPSCINK